MCVEFVNNKCVGCGQPRPLKKGIVVLMMIFHAIVLQHNMKINEGLYGKSEEIHDFMYFPDLRRDHYPNYTSSVNLDDLREM